MVVLTTLMRPAWLGFSFKEIFSQACNAILGTWQIIRGQKKEKVKLKFSGLPNLEEGKLASLTLCPHSGRSPKAGPRKRPFPGWWKTPRWACEQRRGR